jgi:hypothetical protein
MEIAPYRFNLILHGMLGVIKSETGGWDIHVPVPDPDVEGIPVHRAMWGLPELEGEELRGLQAVPHEDFRLSPFDCEAPVGSPCEFDPTEALVLKNLISQPDFRHSLISVPAPTLIKKFRSIETKPGARPDPITVRYALVAQPRCAYEVLVLSYLGVWSSLSFKGNKGTVQPIDTQNGSAANFNIYYQTFEPQCSTGDDTVAFDRMFKVRIGSDSRPIEVGGLSTQAPSSDIAGDGPPSSLQFGTGLRTDFLRSLSELSLRTEVHALCSGDPTSCRAVIGSYAE